MQDRGEDAEDDKGAEYGDAYWYSEWLPVKFSLSKVHVLIQPTLPRHFWVLDVDLVAELNGFSS